MELSRIKSAAQFRRLDELTAISTGYSYRGGFVASDDGPLVIQLRNLDGAGNIAVAGLLRGASDGATDAHFVHPGDLLFRSRGAKLTAAVVPSGTDGMLLAAPLIRIRIGSAPLLPEYLVWYINGKKGQEYLKTRTMGSTVRMIDMQALKEMPIPVPPLALQSAACELIALQKREADLTARLLEQRSALIDMTIGLSLDASRRGQ